MDSWQTFPILSVPNDAPIVEVRNPNHFVQPCVFCGIFRYFLWRSILILWHVMNIWWVSLQFYQGLAAARMPGGGVTASVYKVYTYIFIHIFVYILPSGLSAHARNYWKNIASDWIPKHVAEDSGGPKPTMASFGSVMPTDRYMYRCFHLFPGLLQLIGRSTISLSYSHGTCRYWHDRPSLQKPAASNPSKANVTKRLIQRPQVQSCNPDRTVSAKDSQHS